MDAAGAVTLLSNWSCQYPSSYAAGKIKYDVDR
jgi:hypothetical protein